MKIHLYKNTREKDSRPLIEVVNQVSGMDLAKREKVLADTTILMEECREDNEFYFMDFALRRMDNGPGHSISGEQTEDFDLQDNAGFGEQTAVIYYPKKEFVAVQYNHHGPRATKIAQYFSQFQTGEQTGYFTWAPVLDDSVQEKLKRSSVQTKLNYKMDMSSVSETASRNVSLAHLLDITNEYNAGMIEITISHGQNKRSGPLKGVVDKVLKVLKHEDAIRSMKVSVKDQHDSPCELLDMLNHRLVQEVDDKNLSKTKGLRYTFDSRIKLMGRVFNQWLESR